MDYSNFVNDDHYQVTDTGWSDIREQKRHSMPMCNVKVPNSFEVDWYHAMGCFYACEGGPMIPEVTENEERHTFKAPYCCFENAPYTDLLLFAHSM